MTAPDEDRAAHLARLRMENVAPRQASAEREAELAVALAELTAEAARAQEQGAQVRRARAETQALREAAGSVRSTLRESTSGRMAVTRGIWLWTRRSQTEHEQF
jgi:hypothetical protein